MIGGGPSVQQQATTTMQMAAQTVNLMPAANSSTVPVMYMPDSRGVSVTGGNASVVGGAEQYQVVTTTTTGPGSLSVGGSMAMDPQQQQQQQIPTQVGDNNGLLRQVPGVSAGIPPPDAL